MFQTELLHLLQSLENGFFIGFMKFISFFGGTTALMLTIFFIMFSINFKKGWILVNILLCGSIVSRTLKSYVNYPRPLAVDTTLKTFGNNVGETNLRDLEPKTFFESFSPALLEKARTNTEIDNGFPSGHMVLITTLWLGISILFARKIILLISILLIFLTGISRMYLAQHYLGDVLGGMTAGLLVIILFSVLILNQSELNFLLELKRSGEILQKNKNMIIIMGLPLLGLLFYHHAPLNRVAEITAVNLSVVIISYKKFPFAFGVWWKRAITVVTAILLYIGCSALFSRIIGNEILSAFLTTFCCWTISGLVLNFVNSKNN